MLLQIMRGLSAGWSKWHLITPRRVFLTCVSVLQTEMESVVPGNSANTAISRDLGGSVRWSVFAFIHTDLFPPPSFFFAFLIPSIHRSVWLSLKGSRDEGVDEEKIEKDAKVRH